MISRKERRERKRKEARTKEERVREWQGETHQLLVWEQLTLPRSKLLLPTGMGEEKQKGVPSGSLPAQNVKVNWLENKQH